MMTPGISNSKSTVPRRGDFVVFHFVFIFCFGKMLEPQHNGLGVNGK